MTDPPARSGAWRAGFAGVLALAMAAGTFVGPMFAVLSRFLIDDVGLTRTEVGWLVTAFALVGALLSPAAGRLTDWTGGKRALLAIFALSAIGLAAIAAAPTYVLLLAASALAGLAQAAANPATNKLIAAHIAPGRRGMITGIKQSGVQGGIFLAGALLPVGALAMGWRATAAIAAIVPALSLVAALWLVPLDPPGSIAADGGARGRVPPSVWWLAVYGFLMGTAGGALTTYIPLYAQEAAGFSVTDAGLVAGVVGLTAFGARIAWAGISERMGHFSVPLGLIAGLSIAALGLLGGAGLGTPWLLWPAALGLGVTVSSWNSVAMLAVITEAGPGRTGHGSGIVLLGFLLGLAAGPPLFGYSVDATLSYTLGLVGTGALFLASLATMVIWRTSDVALRRV